MIEKLKIAFADFLDSLRRFWLEVMGGVFLALSIFLSYETIKQYRNYTRGSETVGMGMVVTIGIFSVVMLYFALDSFWKSRKPR